MKWKVYGKTTVSVCVNVEADDEDSAIDAAYDELSHLTSYAGNGGTDKLVGVNNRNCSIEPCDEIEYTEPVKETP